jgi:hypothetical protein
MKAPICAARLSSPKTWVAEAMLPNDGLVSLEDRHIDELYAAAKEIISNPLPTEGLRPKHFDMPACQTLMGQVRKQIDDRIGFAIIDRLPVDNLDTNTVKKLYWLLMNMIGRTVAQKWDGTMVYDVTDVDKRINPATVCGHPRPIRGRAIMLIMRSTCRPILSGYSA